jgi:hypothetical protein
MNIKPTPVPITRVAAIAQGRSTYYTDKPCQLGNKAERLVKSAACLCHACRTVRAAAEKARRAARKAGEA